MTGRREGGRAVDDRLPFRASSLSASYDGLSTVPVTVLLDNVRSIYNVGAFFRTADNAGVDEVVLCGITGLPEKALVLVGVLLRFGLPPRGAGRPPHPRLAKTALGAEQAVRWRWAGDPVEEIARLRERGVEVAALETDPRATDLFDWQPRFPVCVVFGHEVDGVSEAARQACDTLVRVPTLGRKQSLNVATAGGVVCYELLRRYRALSK